MILCHPLLKYKDDFSCDSLSSSFKVKRRRFLWLSVILFQSTKSHPLSKYKDDFSCDYLSSSFKVKRRLFLWFSFILFLWRIFFHSQILSSQMPLFAQHAVPCIWTRGKKRCIFRSSMNCHARNSYSLCSSVQMLLSTLRVRFGKYEATQAWEFGSLFFTLCFYLQV